LQAGARLRPGDVVRTGDHGAILDAGGRRIWLGHGTAVQVRDGGRQWLQAGSALVGSRNGPPLTVRVADLTVEVAGGSGVRIKRGFTNTVGVLVGSAQVHSETGRSLTVDALHQASTTGASLPSEPRPLQLTDDAAARAVAPHLVHDDVELDSLARGLDSGTAGREAVVRATAFVTGPHLGLVRIGTPSETVLPLAIAQSAGSEGLAAHYQRALSLRAAGGSWGVIAHLLDTTASRAGAALNTIEKPPPVLAAGQEGQPLPAGTGARAGNTGTTTTGGGTASGSGTASAGGGTGARGGAPASTSTARRQPSPPASGGSSSRRVPSNARASSSEATPSHSGATSSGPRKHATSPAPAGSHGAAGASGGPGASSPPSPSPPRPGVVGTLLGTVNNVLFGVVDTVLPK
jgi:hypothetical protein